MKLRGEIRLEVLCFIISILSIPFYKSKNFSDFMMKLIEKLVVLVRVNVVRASIKK